MSVVYLVDVSHSVASRAITDAAVRIDALTAELRPSHSRIVAFGADVAVLDDTKALRDLAATDPADRAGLGGAPRSDGPRAGAAPGACRTRARTCSAHRPVLGRRDTSGDVTDATSQLAATGIPVFVEPLEPRDIGDTWIDRIALPDRLGAGGLVTVTIEVGSQRRAEALVELKLGDRVVAPSRPPSRRRDDGAAGRDVCGPGRAAGGCRRHRIGRSARGKQPAVSRSQRRTSPRVLYIESAIASARYLQGALTQSGFEVTVRPPAGIPQQAADLDPWDVVILSDIARSAISDAAMKALAVWVERDGGGLLVAGGDAVFGEAGEGGPGGYRNTELERLTPVTFERKDEPEIALIIVLDKSWSMAGAVMELCKAAAQPPSTCSPTSSRSVS